MENVLYVSYVIEHLRIIYIGLIVSLALHVAKQKKRNEQMPVLRKIYILTVSGGTERFKCKEFDNSFTNNSNLTANTMCHGGERFLFTRLLLISLKKIG